MEKNDINIYVGQEPWREGSEKGFESLEVNDYKIFLHSNTETQTGNKWGSGGVAIFLNKRAHDAWTKAGQPTPMLGGKVGDYTCLIGIHLHFKTDKLVHKQFVVSLYHPHIGKNTESIDNFYEGFHSQCAAKPHCHNGL